MKRLILALAVLSSAAGFAIEPSRGKLIFADDFKQTLLFAERWMPRYSHIRPEVEEGAFFFPNGGTLLLRQDVPKQFYAEMDFIIPPDTGAKHPARGGFMICGEGFVIGHEGRYFKFRGDKIPGFEYGKPVHMELIRRRKDDDHSEYVFIVNGNEVSRKVASDINPKPEKDRNWDKLGIWSYGLPYRVTCFKLWSLIDDPRGASPNLVANGSFESSYDGNPELFERRDNFPIWQEGSYTNYEHYLGLVQVDTKEKHSGKQSLRLVKDDTVKSQGVKCHTGVAPKEAPCLFSLWMKADRDGLPVSIRCGKNPKKVMVDKKWRRYDVHGDGGSNPSLEFSENGTLWVDDWQVEAGDLESPTEYRSSDADSLKVYFAKLKDGDTLPKSKTPTRHPDKVAENRAKGLDIDGKPLKPLEVLGRLSFYMTEPEAAFRMTANVVVPAGAKATLSCAGQKASVEVAASEEPGAKFDIKIPLTDVADGTYPVEVELCDGAGQILAKGEGQLRKLPFKEGASQINHFSRCVLHDGKPVVPMAPFIGGMYHPGTASSNVIAGRLDVYKFGGFNAVNGLFPFYYPEEDATNKFQYGRPNIGGPKEFIEGTERRGLLAIPWTDAMKYSDEKLAALSEFLAHTNILAHMVLDEPEIHRGYTGEEAAAHVRRMREADPYHPMFMNQCFYGIPNNYAGRESDIFMIDDYLTNNHQMRTVASVVDNMVSMWDCGVEKGVPVWFYLVGANMGLHGREPSYDQQIAQTYGCLAEGCSGFAYFYGTIMTESNWRALTQLAVEMKALTPAIASEEICGKTVADVDHSKLRIRTMRVKNILCIVACNVEDKALGKVTFTLPPEAKDVEKVGVMFEDRARKVKKGEFTDTFNRWERHVYKVKLAE